MKKAWGIEYCSTRDHSQTQRLEVMEEGDDRICPNDAFPRTLTDVAFRIPPRMAFRYEDPS